MLDFLDRLAAATAAPGGGGAAAAVGAMGAALVSMACRLTVGRPRFAASEPHLQETLGRSEALRLELSRLVEQDGAAFGAVMAAFRLPKTTPTEQTTRRETIQAAMQAATLIPLATAQACAEVLSLCDQITDQVNPNALGDIRVGRVCAEAGLRAALITARLNLKAITDRDFARSRQAILDQLAERYGLPLT